MTRPAVSEVVDQVRAVLPGPESTPRRCATTSVAVCWTPHRGPRPGTGSIRARRWECCGSSSAPSSCRVRAAPAAGSGTQWPSSCPVGTSAPPVHRPGCCHDFPVNSRCFAATPAAGLTVGRPTVRSPERASCCRQVRAMATPTARAVREPDSYAFLAVLGKRVIHPGGRASTDRLLAWEILRRLRPGGYSLCGRARETRSDPVRAAPRCPSRSRVRLGNVCCAVDLVFCPGPASRR